MRVVFDTNVFVSAFVIPGSLSEEAYRRARAGDVELFTSVAILTELASTLRAKFHWEESPIIEALKSVSRAGEVLRTTPHLRIVRDVTDNRILECAELAEADLIVTGDPHLLKLRRFDQTGIVKVSTFLHVIAGQPRSCPRCVRYPRWARRTRSRYPRSRSHTSSHACVVSPSDSTSTRSSLPWNRPAIASAVSVRENRPKP